MFTRFGGKVRHGPRNKPLDFAGKQSINQFITRHSTEARSTMSLSQTEKECLNSVLENVNGWSSPTAQGHITRRLELASSGGYARQTVEQLRRENPEFTAPDLWPPNSPWTGIVWN